MSVTSGSPGGSGWGAIAPLALCACLLTGCYAYAPLPTATPLPGTRVSAALTDSGSLELASLVGPRIVALDGRVVSASEQALVLSVFKTTDLTAEQTSWRGEVVSLAPPLVANLQARTLSKGRSLLFTGAALVGSFAVFKVFQVGFTALGGSGGGGSEPR